MAYALLFASVGVWEVVQPSIGEQYLGDRRILNASQWRIKALLLGLPGFFAGHLGYYLSGAPGRNWLSKLALTLAAIGALASMANAVSIGLTLRDHALFGQLWPLGQWVSTFLFGVGAVLTKKVRMWKRVWPLWTGVAPQVLFPLYIFVLGWPAFAALATNGLNWIVFGALIWSEGEQIAGSRSNQALDL